jgi:small subunit ribosomal protein S18
MEGSESKGSRKGNTSRNKYRAEFTGDHVFDYKDPLSLTRFVTDGGKITPARISKLSINLQRKVANAVKKARSLALLPTGMVAYDGMGRIEAISPAPFEV